MPLGTKDGGGIVCARCFYLRKKCSDGDGKLCERCSDARADQTLICPSPLIYNHECVLRLRQLAASLEPWPFFDDKVSYIVQCHATSTSEIFRPRQLSFTGAFGVANANLVTQLDQVLWDLCTPHIGAEHQNNSSVLLACRCIGYINFLYSVDLVDMSEPPYNDHEISTLFAETIFMRLDDSVVRLMEFVRCGQSEIDAESRPGVYLLYFYLSDLDTLCKKWKNCTIFNDRDLYGHVGRAYKCLKTELEDRVKTDCSSKMNWPADFRDKKTEVHRKVRKQLPNKSWQLSLKLSLNHHVSNSNQPPNPNHARDRQSQGNETGSGSSVSDDATMASVVSQSHHISSTIPLEQSVATTFRNPSEVGETLQQSVSEGNLNPLNNIFDDDRSHTLRYPDNFFHDAFAALSHDNCFGVAQNLLEPVVGVDGFDNLTHISSTNDMSFDPVPTSLYQGELDGTADRRYVQPSSLYQGHWS